MEEWKKFETNRLSSQMIDFVAKRVRGWTGEDEVVVPEKLHIWYEEGWPRWSKRLRNWLWKEYGMSDQKCDEVGVDRTINRMSDYLASGDFIYALSDSMDWDQGEYGDGGSCFWESYRGDSPSEPRTLVSKCEQAGALLVRSHGEGRARCIFYLLHDPHLEAEGFHADAVVLTNAYGLPMQTLAHGSINSEAFGPDFDHIVRPLGLRAGIYLNGDSRMLARSKGGRFNISHKLSTEFYLSGFRELKRCHHCGEILVDGERYPIIRMGQDDEVCYDCFNAHYTQCGLCNTWVNRMQDTFLDPRTREIVTVDGRHFCRHQYCLDRLAECQVCGEFYIRTLVEPEHSHHIYYNDHLIADSVCHPCMADPMSIMTMLLKDYQSVLTKVQDALHEHEVMSNSFIYGTTSHTEPVEETWARLRSGQDFKWIIDKTLEAADIFLDNAEPGVRETVRPLVEGSEFRVALEELVDDCMQEPCMYSYRGLQYALMTRQIFIFARDIYVAAVIALLVERAQARMENGENRDAFSQEYRRIMELPIVQNCRDGTAFNLPNLFRLVDSHVSQNDVFLRWTTDRPEHHMSPLTSGPFYMWHGTTDGSPLYRYQRDDRHGHPPLGRHLGP